MFIYHNNYKISSSHLGPGRKKLIMFTNPHGRTDKCHRGFPAQTEGMAKEMAVPSMYEIRKVEREGKMKTTLLFIPSSSAMQHFIM